MHPKNIIMPHSTRYRFLLFIVFLLTLVTAGCSKSPSPTPTPLSEAVATSPAPLQGSITPAPDQAVREIGLDPSSITLDAQGLVSSWHAVAVGPIPFGVGGPGGLPAHLQVLFDHVQDPQARPPGAPVIYLIPVKPYRALWEAHESGIAPAMLDRIAQWNQALPQPAPTRGLPALPVREAQGVNDLATQVRPVAGEQHQGFRYVGRFAFQALPVTNAGLRYVYQGLSQDGRYLIAFFYPVRTDELPDDLEEIPEEEQARLNEDGLGYLESRAQTLDALPSDAWSPDLARLDALIASLRWADR